MTEPCFHDRSAHALRLRVYDRPVDRSGLPTFARGRARGRGVRVKAAVIGSSHWMEVRSGHTRLTEMLACHPAPAGRPAAVWRPGDSAVEQCSRNGGRYRFEARIAPWERIRAEMARLRELVAVASLAPQEVGLAYEFPCPHGGLQRAETLVWAAVTEDGVSARTAHSYPSEGLVVLSATDIRLAAVSRDRLERDLVASVGA